MERRGRCAKKRREAKNAGKENFVSIVGYQTIFAKIVLKLSIQILPRHPNDAPKTSNNNLPPQTAGLRYRNTNSYRGRGFHQNRMTRVQQTSMGNNTAPQPRGALVKALLRNISQTQYQQSRAQFADRRVSTMKDGYVASQIPDFTDVIWEERRKSPSPMEMTKTSQKKAAVGKPRGPPLRRNNITTPSTLVNILLREILRSNVPTLPPPNQRPTAQHITQTTTHISNSGPSQIQ
jgi:hypothetical protein